MTTQELIERIEGLKNIFGNKNEYIKIDMVVELISELDEPQKVTIPQYIADKIEYMKKYDYNIFDAMRATERDDKFYDWIFADDNMETFTRAWLDGYEVEKEKRYIVSLKNGQPLVKAPLGGNFYFNQNITAGNCKATRKQLEEAGFGWVFDCEGVEVEEVE